MSQPLRPTFFAIVLAGCVASSTPHEPETSPAGSTGMVDMDEGPSSVPGDDAGSAASGTSGGIVDQSGGANTTGTSGSGAVASNSSDSGGTATSGTTGGTSSGG